MVSGGMLLKQLNLRKYSDEIAFWGGALRLELQLLQSTYLCAEVACLRPVVLGNQSIFTSRHHSNSLRSCLTASFLVFPSRGQDPDTKDLDVKTWFAICRWFMPKTYLSTVLPDRSSFLLKMPQPWFSCRPEWPEQLKTYFGWNSEQSCSQSLLLINKHH